MTSPIPKRSPTPAHTAPKTKTGSLASRAHHLNTLISPNIAALLTSQNPHATPSALTRVIFASKPTHKLLNKPYTNGKTSPLSPAAYMKRFIFFNGRYIPIENN